MAPPETEEQKKEREEQEKKAQQKSMLDWLNPRNWFSGIGDIFTMLIVAIVAYVVLGNEKVQQFIGKFFDGDKPGSGADKIAGFVNGIKETVGGWLQGLGIISDDITERVMAATPEDALKDLPPSLQSVMSENSAAGFNAIRKIAVEANGGKITYGMKDTFLTNEKTLFALLTQESQLVKRMMTALKSDAASPTAMSEKGKEMAGNMLKSLQTIVADDVRLNILLNKENRDNTFAIMRAMAPADKQGDLATLEKMVDTSQKENGGTISAAVKSLFIKGLSDAAASYGAAPTESTAPQTSTTPTGQGTETPTGRGTDPAVTLTSATTPAPKFSAGEAFDAVSNATDASGKKLLNTQNIKALTDLRKAMGDDSFAGLMHLAMPLMKGTLSAEEKDVISTQIRVGLLKDHYKAAQAFAKNADIANLPADMKGAIQELKDQGAKPEAEQKAAIAIAKKDMDPQILKAIFLEDVTHKPIKPTMSTVMMALLDPASRGAIQQAGTGNVATLLQAEISSSRDPKLKALAPLATKQNLDAMVKFGNAVGKIYTNSDKIKKVGIITNAMIEFTVNGNSTLMQQQSPLIAHAFHNVPGFEQAFHTLIQELNIPDKAALLGAIHRNWGHLNKPGKEDEGFVEILANAAALKELPAMMNEAKNNPNKSDASWGLDFASGKFAGTDGKLYENIGVLQNIGAAAKSKAKIVTI